ncbi:unnamed protein product [Paramecium pentaurelia]|uniref:Uncharacterized protein n=1 Tax=Paramecium pentaurelia TaxID=43138 RepID=A0A8S1WKG1_9CILI|nr:unnamed protein product [Paramecium pentaurelia]
MFRQVRGALDANHAAVKPGQQKMKLTKQLINKLSIMISITLVKSVNHQSFLLKQHTLVCRKQYKFANQVLQIEILVILLKNTSLKMDSLQIVKILVMELANFFIVLQHIIHYEKNKAPGCMKHGHTFTIEPIINQGNSLDFRQLDGCYCQPQLEQSILITEGGSEVLAARLPASLPLDFNI